MNDETDDKAQDEAPNQGGRPTEYRPELCQIAANLCIGGATDFEVAESIGVSVRTIYRWKAEHPEFRHSLQVGKEFADDRVEASLYHRSIGYSHRAVKIMQNSGVPVIVPYVEHVPPDVGAISLWLTNRRGEAWRHKQSLEHSGPNGGPIETRDVDYLSDAELETLIRRARPASVEPPEGSS